MVAEEWPHHLRLIGLVAVLQHGIKAISPCCSIWLGQRSKGERRRAFEIAGKQEPAGWQRGERPMLAAAPEIAGERRSQPLGIGVVGVLEHVGAVEFAQKGLGLLGMAGFSRPGQRIGAPFGKAQPEQWQVEQPFAGIVDNIEIERRGAGHSRPPFGRLVFEHDAQLRNPARAFRPGRRICRQRRHMLLISETRNGGVWIFGELGADEAPIGQRREAGQASLGQQIMHQRGDENGFSGARQPGHAQPQGRGQDPAGAIGKIGEGNAQFVGDRGRRLRQGVSPVTPAR